MTNYLQKNPLLRVFEKQIECFKKEDHPAAQ